MVRYVRHLLTRFIVSTLMQRPLGMGKFFLLNAKLLVTELIWICSVDRGYYDHSSPIPPEIQASLSAYWTMCSVSVFSDYDEFVKDDASVEFAD